ncbi:MAG: esterase-like activity of phytase family protein [Leptolyngbya sp.]|nr:esterase-like activity of phytase family protein [Leptolyngbya sp.]
MGDRGGNQGGLLVRGRWWGLRWAIALCILLTLGSCALPQLRAEDRLFLDLQVDLLDMVTLPPQTVEETPVGGLSALAYDRQRQVFYALSDDRGNLAPPRVYTLDLSWRVEADTVRLNPPQVLGVTLLRDGAGNPYPANVLDPEGLALSPRDSWFITSEGVADTDSPPQLNDYDLASGTLLTPLRLPDRFLPDAAADSPQGVRNNLGLEGLTLNPTTAMGEFEPFRLFTMTESALAQDFSDDPATPLVSRFLHYLIGPNQSTLISEHVYPLALEPLGAVVTGVSELLCLDQGGHFLALERAFGLRGFDVKLWQLATGGATDTSTLARLNLDTLRPIQKQLVLDFNALGPPVDNLEALALGPPLPDGSQSLWVLSDDNFSEEQTTQLWLLRLRGA